MDFCDKVGTTTAELSWRPEEVALTLQYAVSRDLQVRNVLLRRNPLTSMGRLEGESVGLLVGSVVGSLVAEVPQLAGW
jgi:hypothetical protein